MRMTLVLLLAVISLASAGQNLVPNPSFEDTLCAPEWWEIPHFFGAKHWRNVNAATPDFYGPENLPLTCGQVLWNHSGGPFDGERMIGCRILQDSTSCGTELVQTALIDSLLQDSCYSIKIRVFRTAFYQHATNCVFAYLKNGPVEDNTTICSPQGLVDPISFTSETILDSLQWVELTAEYTAYGGETHLTIGNAEPYDDCTFAFVSETSVNPGAYYLFDQIEVVPCFEVSVEHIPPSNLTLIPLGNKRVRVSNPLNQDLNIQVYTASGLPCHTSQINSSSHLLELSDLPSGLYMIRASSSTSLITLKLVL